jgi:hypothetical protein
MGTTTNTSPYEAAVRAAVAEIERLQGELQDQRTGIAKTESRLAELRSAVDGLLHLFSEDERKQWESRLRELVKPATISPESGSEAYREIVGLLLADTNKSWKVEKVQRELSDRGYDVSTKSVYNALNRLAAKGALERIRRGVYRAKEYGFVINTSDYLLEEDVDE